MANYQSIKGFNIQSKSSDPVPYAQELADNPYGGSWASGGTLNTTRAELAGTVGTQTAAMATGRSTPAPTTINEQYNGSSWTEVGDLNTGRGRAAAAATSYTASIVFGGVNNPGDTTQAITEKWNGTSWTEVNDLPAATCDMAGLGTQTSAFCVGGTRTAASNLVYSWDGTNWTAGTAINTARQYLAASGTTPAALVFGGRNGPSPGAMMANNESWNGSSWTEVTDLNTARFQLSGFGTSTSSLALGGGTPSSTAKTESWNGTSWTEVNDLASAASFQTAAAGASNSSGLAVNGTTSQEWAFSGLPPSTPAADYSDSIVGDMYYNSTTGQYKAIKNGGAPVGTWASGGSLNTARIVYGGSFGATVPTTVIAGGETTTAQAVTEAYDGTAYTEVADLNTARGAAGGDGSSTAGIIIGGETTTLVTNTETWNGSSWTEVNDINTATRLAGSTTSGTNTAVLLFGGLAPSNSAKTESWNGSSWTEVNDLNTARYGQMGSGVSTAALSSSGASPPIPNVESWNGTSWTEITDVNTARRGGGSVGRQTDTLIYGGDPSHAQTEFWNGTSWTEVNDLGSAQQWGGGGANGASTAAIFSGSQPTAATTQEFSAADFSIKTVTTS